LNYKRWYNKGYNLNLTTKLYCPTKPNRYLGLKIFGRYFSYEHKTVPVYILYHDEPNIYDVQSETSKVLGLALICGWQQTLWKHLNFDFYAGVGAFKRWGEVTVYSGGFFPYGKPLYPFTFNTSAWFPSFQGGVKIGYRFGKRKTH
jgi:hypothetical protein